MKDIVKLNRRDILKTGAAMGGGLMLAWYLPFAEPADAVGRPSPFAPNAFLRDRKSVV